MTTVRVEVTITVDAPADLDGGTLAWATSAACEGFAAAEVPVVAVAARICPGASS